MNQEPKQLIKTESKADGKSTPDTSYLSPTNSSVHSKQAQESPKEGLFRNTKFRAIILLLVLLNLVLLLIAFLTKPTIIIGLALFDGAAILVIRSALNNKNEKALFQSFATSNNYTYSAFARASDIADQTSIMFSMISGELCYDVVSGTYYEVPFVLFDFNNVAHPDNRQSAIGIRFGTKLPSFILKHRSEAQQLNSNNPITANGYSQTLKLEGNFDKYFLVYIKPNTQVDVLAILAPDLMQLLLNLQDFEIELTSGGSLCVYSRRLIKNEQEIHNFFAFLSLLIAKIEPYAHSQHKLTSNQA